MFLTSKFCLKGLTSLDFDAKSIFPSVFFPSTSCNIVSCHVPRRSAGRGNVSGAVTHLRLLSDQPVLLRRSLGEDAAPCCLLSGAHGEPLPRNVAPPTGCRATPPFFLSSTKSLRGLRRGIAGSAERAGHGKESGRWI